MVPLPAGKTWTDAVSSRTRTLEDFMVDLSSSGLHPPNELLLILALPPDKEGGNTLTWTGQEPGTGPEG